ncbi:SfnB family sulfur acquisition oxidoreductase [Williamsia sp.]|uniref:SfnB family sulfur acquisition oxidoreductase n=1 Tax=Williamsia sp. TaxID=1872085 RepID=UPI002F93F807
MNSTAIATRIDSAEQALSTARTLAAHFATGAAARDRDRKLPHREIDELSASGLLAITVPAQYGGADLAPGVVAEVIRILAAADPNIAQIPHSHFVYLNLLRLAGTPTQQRDLFSDVLGGGRIANAQSERGGKTIAAISTTVKPESGGLRLDGSKFYCTGSLYAHTLAVLAKLVDPSGESGLEPGEYVAFIPADIAGVRIVDDWNGLGQRTTGSGTITFEAVTVYPKQLVARAKAINAPAGYGAFAQLLHVAIDAGIASGALRAATEFARTKSRPWFEAAVDRAVDDPLLIQRFGELAVEVRTAEATLSAAANAVDATFSSTPANAKERAAEASIAVATAKIVADRAANEVSSALFEVSGTRSAAADLGLDHFWRNARTHTLHDPVRWKYQHIGRALLHDSPPPLHGVI